MQAFMVFEVCIGDWYFSIVSVLQKH